MVVIHPENKSAVKLFFTIFLFVIFPAKSQSRCRFPSFLQQDRGGSLWTAAHYHGYFKGEEFTATTTSDDETTTITYTEKCIERQDDKYIVEYQRLNQEPEFLCKQFIKHTNTVIQVRESNKLKYRSPNLCDEKNMRLDHWPLVNYNSEYAKKKVSCPFSGGYNMQMYDPQYLQGYFICDKQVIRPRLQSDCQEGEGITIDFKVRECMHDNLKMGTDLVQHFDCLAHWESGKYTFIIIKPSSSSSSLSGSYKAWCLRLTNPLDDLREGHLFMDFVCDPGVNGKIEETIDYLRINFVKLVISSICADASVGCESRWCEIDLRSHCSRECGDCSGETDVCPFKESVYGSWIESAESVTDVVNVSVYDLYLSGFGQFHCLKTRRKDYENRTVLWQIFDNGCFPRFRCLEMEKISSSVMQYRLSKTLEWPISLHTRAESAVCHSDQFKDNKPIPMKVIVQEGTTYSVHCDLPMTFGFSNNGIFISNEYCNRCISYSRNTSPTVITETLISCSSLGHTPRLIKHECLASIIIDNNTRAVVTKQRHQRHHKHRYDCWVFTIHHNRKAVFLLDATECNADAIENIKEESITYTNRYSVYENETEKCPYLRSITSSPIKTTEFVPPYKHPPTESEPTTNVVEPPRQVFEMIGGNGSPFVHIDLNMLIVLIALSFIR